MIPKVFPWRIAASETLTEVGEADLIDLMASVAKADPLDSSSERIASTELLEKAVNELAIGTSE